MQPLESPRTISGRQDDLNRLKPAAYASSVSEATAAALASVGNLNSSIRLQGQVPDEEEEYFDDSNSSISGEDAYLDDDLNHNQEEIEEWEGVANGLPKGKSEIEGVWDKILILDTNHRGALEGKALCLRKRGSWEKALTHYINLNRVRPNQTSTLLSLAKCYIALRQEHKALEYSQTALMKEPQNPKAIALLLQCDRNAVLEQLEKVASSIEKTSDKPLSISKIFLLAEYRRRRGEWSKAIDYYDAIRRHPKASKISQILNAQIERGEAESREPSRNSRAASPLMPLNNSVGYRDSFEGAKLKIQRELEQKQFDEALRGIRALLETAPSDRDILWMELCCLKGLKEFSKAIDTLTQLQIGLDCEVSTIRNPQDIVKEQFKIRFERGECQRKLNNLHGALEAYQQALEGCPNIWIGTKVRLFAGMAQCTLAFKEVEWDKAFDACVEAEWQFPAGAYASRAWIYKKKGEWVLAIDQYRKAIALSGKDRSLLLLLADCYLRVGWHEHARNIYKDMMVYFPEDLLVWEKAYQCQRYLEAKKHVSLPLNEICKQLESLEQKDSLDGFPQLMLECDIKMIESEKILHRDPKNYLALCGRPFSFWLKGDYDSALVEFEKLLPHTTFNCGRFNCLAALAVLYEKLKQWPEACSYYTQAIEFNQKNDYRMWTYHLGRAHCYLKMGNILKANQDWLLVQSWIPSIKDDKLAHFLKLCPQNK